MRKLTISQKKILNQQVTNGFTNWDELPVGIIEKLEAMNNTEILYQEVNRCLWDGVPVQSMQKVPISCACKIKHLEERKGYLAK